MFFYTERYEYMNSMHIVWTHMAFIHLLIPHPNIKYLGAEHYLRSLSGQTEWWAEDRVPALLEFIADAEGRH